MKRFRALLAILLCLGLLAPCVAMAKKDKADKTPPGQIDNPADQKNKSTPPGLADNPGQRKGPPDHAKAWGQRNKFKYYPESNVYFDPAKGMYFYPDKGGWKSGNEVPRALNLKLGGPVDVEVEGDAPYRFNNDHVIQFKTK